MYDKLLGRGLEILSLSLATGPPTIPLGTVDSGTLGFGDWKFWEWVGKSRLFSKHVLLGTADRIQGVLLFLLCTVRQAQRTQWTWCFISVVNLWSRCLANATIRSSLDAKVVLGKTQPSGLEAWVRCEQFERGYSRKQKHIYIKMQRMFTERCV